MSEVRWPTIKDKICQLCDPIDLVCSEVEIEIIYFIDCAVPHVAVNSWTTMMTY